MDSAVVIVQSHSSASWCVQKKPLLVLIVESRGFFGSANNASCLDNAFVSLHLRIPPRVLHFSALVSPLVGQFNDVIYFATYAISYPIASLLAEAFIGRYKLVSYTLRVLWLLFIAGSVISVCEYCLLIPSSASYMIIHYLVSIPVSALNGAFTAVVISLAIDQISDGSSANISALVVWFIWALFSGVGCSYIIVPVFYQCTHFHEGKLISSLLPIVLLSVGLILDFNFHHILVKEPVSANPVKLIFKVLKYAAKHKYPVQRSAFTYCENKQPTRLDYGKSKYGGPFTTEQVEDVKTFWRILLVVLVISMPYIPLEAVYTYIYPELETAVSPQLSLPMHSACLKWCLHTIFIHSIHHSPL